jgi:hypothetical protein
MKGKLIKCNHFYALQIDNNIIAVSLDKETQSHTVNYKYSLSKQNCDELFGVLDVEKLAEKYYGPGDYGLEIKTGFIKGFNKAIELNKKKVFTATNLKVGMIHLLYLEKEKNEFSEVFKERQFKFIDDYIQHLQKPKEIDVEVEMDRIPADLAPGGWDVFPKLDESGCLILKKVL